jgi:hypothetical protein
VPCRFNAVFAAAAAACDVIGDFVDGPVHLVRQTDSKLARLLAQVSCCGSQGRDNALKLREQVDGGSGHCMFGQDRMAVWSFGGVVL